MDRFDRWRRAQEYEKTHWTKIASEITAQTGDLKWYKWKAGEFQKRIGKYVSLDDSKSERILEIGGGPLGIVTFLGWGERFALDPLENFYNDNKHLVELRDERVKYLQGVGEDIPFDNDYFALVIVDNVLDHCQNPYRALSSIYRVLNGMGYLYIALNVHTVWGSMLRYIMEKFQIDKGHPHTYTKEGLRNSLGKHRFTILDEEIEDYKKIRKRNLLSESMRDKIKGLTGISEILYSAVCRKEPGA